MDLPNEALFEVLLHTPVPDIRKFCRTSKSHENLCNDAYFWREKFARDGVPLIEEGLDWTSWSNIYLSAVDAQKYVSRFLGALQKGVIGHTYYSNQPLTACSILANDVKDPQVFFLSKAQPKEILNYFLLTRLIYNRIRPLAKINLQEEADESSSYKNEPDFQPGSYSVHQEEVIAIEGITSDELEDYEDATLDELPYIYLLWEPRTAVYSFSFLNHSGGREIYSLEVSKLELEEILFKLRYQGCFIELYFA